jgi:DNA-binding GntR family transcriptional regulator
MTTASDPLWRRPRPAVPKVAAARAAAWPSKIEPERRTRADELRLQLADEIVRGTLAPGTALDEAGLARRFCVSRTPVREAIRLLAASGLVELRPHRGAVVARPSAERLNGMFETMAGLEALCAGLAAERMTADERRLLESAHADLQVLIQGGDADRYHAVNESFHFAIYSGAHNDYLAEITLATRGRVQPFRRAQFRNLGRLAKSYVEHDRVVVAILQGDRLAATEAMRDHIMTVWEEYAAYAEATSVQK